MAHMSPMHSASIWAAGLATAMSPDMMVMGVVKKNSRNMSTTLMPGCRGAGAGGRAWVGGWVLVVMSSERAMLGAESNTRKRR